MLIRMLVHTASATEASNWLATPNIGQIVLILPGVDEIAPGATTISVAITAPGSHSGRANGS